MQQRAAESLPTGIQALVHVGNNRVYGQVPCHYYKRLYPSRFQQVCLILANDFSTGLWLSTALCCISVPHLQPEIECHVDGHVIDQSAVRGRCGQMESRKRHNTSGT